MTATEAAQYTAAVTQLQNSLQVSSPFRFYMSGWLTDIAAYSANSNQTSEVSGDVPIGLIASTVALLPASPATGYEAIVTDATSPTVGSTVTGGGSTRVMVKYNGSAYIVE